MSYAISQLPTGYLIEKTEKLTETVARIENYAARGRADFVLQELAQIKHYAGALSDEADRLMVDAKAAV